MTQHDPGNRPDTPDDDATPVRGVPRVDAAPAAPQPAQPSAPWAPQQPPVAGQPGQPWAPQQPPTAPSAAAPDLRRLVGPAITAGISLGATLLLAMVVTVLIGITAVDADLPAGALARLPFFLVGMALLGPLHVGSSAGTMSFSASVAVVPLTLTLVAFLAAAVWTSLRPQPARTAARRWVDSLLVGGVLGVVGALLAAVTRFRFDLDVAVVAVNGTFGVHPLGTLLGGVLVGTLGAAAGHVVRREGVDLGRLGVRLPVVVQRVAGNLLLGLAVASVLLTLLGLVAGFVEAGFAGTILLLLTIAPNVIAWALTLGGFGGIAATDAGTVSLFSEAPGGAWLLLVVVLVAVLVAGVRGLLASGLRPWQDIWVTPAVLLVATLVAIPLTGVRASADGLFPFVGGAGVAVTAGISWTTLLAAVVWGLLVEVVERVLGPVVVTLVPALPRLHTRLARRSGAPATDAPLDASTPAAHAVPGTAAVPGAPVATGAPGVPAGDPAAQPVAATTPGAPVLPTVSRRTAIVVGASVAGAVVLVGGAAAAYAIVSQVVYTPEKPVMAYVEAIEAGRVSDALALVDVDVPEDRRGLLTDEVYADVENRPTGGRVTEVVRRGGNAVVTVESTQAGESVTQTFSLRKDGREALLFDRWVLDPVEVPVASAFLVLPWDTEAFVVNGVEFDAAEGTFPAMPGTYTVSLPVAGGGDGLVTSDAVEMTVRPDGTLAEDLGYDTTLAYTLSDEGHASAEQLATQLVTETCLGTTALEIDECGMYVWEWRADEATDVVWTADGEPAVEVGLDGGYVVVEVRGDAHVTYNLPARDYYEAEAGAEDVEYHVWVRYQVEGGELVEPETSEYGYWD